MITGEETPDAGTFKVGDTVKVCRPAILLPLMSVCFTELTRLYNICLYFGSLPLEQCPVVDVC